MYKITNNQLNNTVGIQLFGKLTKQNYKEIEEFLFKKIETFGSVNALIELRDFDGFELGVVWEDLKFDVKHRGDFGRIAMVGEQKWLEWMTKLSDLFYNAEVEYFEPEERPRAWEWVKEHSRERETATT